MKQNKRSEDISNLSNKRTCLNRNIIELIESRINLIEEPISLNSSSTSKNNGPQDKQEKDNPVSKRIGELDQLEDMAHKDSVIFGSYPSQKEELSKIDNDASNVQEDESTNNTKFQNSILKTANMCVRKIENMGRQKDNSAMIRYCIKKAHKVLKTKSLPNLEETDRIEAQLDLFDKYFYNEDIEDMVPQFDVDKETFDHEDDNFVPTLNNQNSCTQSSKITEDSTNVKEIKVFLSLS